MTGPDGVTRDVTGVGTLIFRDGTIQEDDGSPLIDDLFYYARNLDVWADHVRTGLDAEQHYQASGRAEGRDPNAFFSASAYLAANPDVRAAGADPLTHYDQFGFKAGRNPGPGFDTKSLAGHVDDEGRGDGVVRHSLRYAAVTRCLRAGVDIRDPAGSVG